MKRYYDESFFHDYQNKKHRSLNTPLAREQKAGGFRCAHCRAWVGIDAYIGTANRNHCNGCLWSRHVDIKKGDRMAECRGGMEPLGLTLKHEGFGRHGELMLIHMCCGCGKISINRIARDDSEGGVLMIFEQSLGLDDLARQRLGRSGIELLEDASEVRQQLFGVV